MGETMPNPTNWVEFYQRSPSTPVFSHIRISDATVVTTTATSLVPSNQLTPNHGRVSKPIRRRSRASRKTPTTVLNTDTTNFRAMVQQFTGGSNASFGASQGPPYLGFGSSSSNVHVNPTSGAYNVIQFQQRPPPQNQLPPYIFSRPPPGNMGARGSLAYSESGSSPSNENKSENNFMF